MQERTQKEAIEFIYNREYENINVNPFVKARKRLQEAGLLEHDGQLRNANYRSIVSPVLENTDTDHSEGEIRGLFDLETIESLSLTRRKENGRLSVRHLMARIIAYGFEDIKEKSGETR